MQDEPQPASNPVPPTSSPRPRGRPRSWMTWGALATFCVSCLPLLLTSFVAAGALLGLGTLRLVETPVDPVLDVLEIPLFLASVGIIGWATWKGPRPAFALAMAGGLLALTGLLIMPHGGADDHEASGHGAVGLSSQVSLTLSIIAFGLGLVLVAGGLVSHARHARRGLGGPAGSVSRTKSPPSHRDVK